MNTVHVNGKDRKLAWKRDLPDPRDKAFRLKAPLTALLRLSVVKDPRKSNPRSLPKVEDQGEIGSCVAHASTSAFEMVRRLRVLKQGLDPDQTVPEMSRLFVYWASRVMMDNVQPTEDAGTFVRSAMRVLRQYGAAPEMLWPYSPARFSEKPPQVAWDRAKAHQLVSDHVCTSLTDLLWALDQDWPVAGGFLVPESMMAPETQKTGRVAAFAKGEDNLGGHAVLFVGYDRRAKELIFQNSWGPSWGERGYGRLPFVFWNEGWLADCRAVKVVE